ncbi:four helix bundle protein [Taibaiella soli]|uniref:Four helix bundle protein n=1 Tax=Taibaiella soli TaxID=1649169 RepID=A0A2W2ACT0_9BACT|nr:four helix bundle protein [Taibaiella soli]PZF71422.1 four helix bundle protein [Taibaiella soli]
MRNYRNYEVRQRAHEFCLFIYKEIASGFPTDERFGLTSQLKRSSASTPLNIVEGCGRNSEKDFVHFLDIALGSLNETEYCLLLAFDLDFIPKPKYDIASEKINAVKAMLIGLIKSIRAKNTSAIR